MSYSLSLKGLLLKDQNWYHYHQYYSQEENGGIRDSVVNSITQVLSCKQTVRGYSHYHCSNPDCTHEKRSAFTCKNRVCNSCGRIATENWMEKQKAILPFCEWQHVTLTMPSELWPFFNVDRKLLNTICALAADVLLTIAKKKGVLPGIFLAIHTFGRDLKWNVHFHLSVTRGGLCDDKKTWKSLFFKASIIMRMWRYRVIKLFRSLYNNAELTLPGDVSGKSFNQFLDKQYKKSWHIHCAKPSNDPIKDLTYLSRYIKRPPFANSRLKHYDGNDVIFQYLNHTTKKHNLFKCDVFHFITRLTQHIHEKGFRMIRYYGFLANRVRGKLLPIVNELFHRNNTEPAKVTWQALLKQAFGLDPLECVLCKSPMRLSYVKFGLSNSVLRSHHDKLAQKKYVRH